MTALERAKQELQVPIEGVPEKLARPPEESALDRARRELAPTPEQSPELTREQQAYFDRLKNGAYNRQEIVGHGGQEAIERGLEQGASFGFGEHVKGAVSAAGQAIKNTFSSPTMSDVVRGVHPTTPGEAYDATVASDRAANKASSKAFPLTTGITNAVGSFVVPGPSSLIKGAGAIPTVGRIVANAAEGAVGGVGFSDAKDSGEALKAAKQGAAVPAAFGALGLAGRGVAKVAEKAIGKGVPGGPSIVERALGQVMLRSVKKGASASESKRAFGNPTYQTNAVDLISKEPKLRAAVRSGDQEKMIEAAQDVIDRAKPITAPVYAKIDTAIGKVDPEAVKGAIDAEIATLNAPGKISGSESRIRSLENMKANIDTLAKDGKFSSTQDLRDFTTGLLAQKNTTIGSLAETPGFAHRRDNHEVVNKFLNDRIDSAAKAVPELAPEIETLRNVNRETASALGIIKVAGNAVDNATHRRKDITERAYDVAKGMAGPGAVIASLAGAHPSQVAAVAAGAVAPAAVKWATKEATFALSKYANLIRTNADAGKRHAARIAALKAGVPRAIIRGLVGPNEEQPSDEELSE